MKKPNIFAWAGSTADRIRNGIKNSGMSRAGKESGRRLWGRKK